LAIGTRFPLLLALHLADDRLLLDWDAFRYVSLLTIEPQKANSRPSSVQIYPRMQISHESL